MLFACGIGAANLLLRARLKQLLVLLAIGGGILILTGHSIPFTTGHYNGIPGGSTTIGALLVLFGLLLGFPRD